ncbi:glycosyltransferase family 39 protein [Leptospira gomenensis]|uniref:Glycosyltransferase family 39 protein n=1 Tax=Leptospira gomenensis TaxID=2484974 RepID=A0A5F1YTE9_9LEPT|nr:glycosyltransferase family 39 protein [Leptospira gomenensis]TGK31802.1 glycosyltransferase family 39 protein [Leptospira gomenensis]TGK34786.1 glycosyltransferase family 39 protein [Leptospira gomenensis]TGK41571.1 glycosyltransferase family 39 protein [Leptospira gomenensis]TGK61471.1 glycosyltransferase family 39 protein [Leptospira gomenensis]
MNQISSDTSFLSKKFLFVFLLVAILPLLFTFPLDVIDIDSSQYAEISREMVEGGNPFFIRDNGRRYLDKPILTFWKISLSFLIFGYENFAFRLPAILFTLLSFWGIFKLTELYSGSRTRAWLAVFLYSLSPGLYSMVVDPKIDVYLTPYLILVHAFYYLALKKNKNYYYLMYFSMGLGFVTKGPIAMVISAISIGGDILFRRDWKRLFEMRLFPGALLALLPPLLWSIPLYFEFQTYGPYFFLWIQSFGRFYAKMYNQKFNPLFFYSNFSWAFGIFILPFFGFVAFRIREFMKRSGFKGLFQNILKNEYSSGDFVPGFWLFLFLFLISFSKYQLPQYIYWCLPAAAVIGSGVLESILFSVYDAKGGPFWKTEKILMFATGIFFLIAVAAIPVFSVDVSWTYTILPILYAVVFLWTYLRGNGPTKTLAVWLFPISLFLSVVSLYLYPMLTSYQPSKEIGSFIREHEVGKEKLFLFGVPASKRSYAYYSKRIARTLFDPAVLYEAVRQDGERYVVVQDKWVGKMGEFFGDGLRFETVREFPAYKVATPEGKFFLKSHRSALAGKVILMRATLKKSEKK